MTSDDPFYCGKEAHIHNESCMEKVLVCGKEETVGHVHSVEDGCYTDQHGLNANPEAPIVTDAAITAELKNTLICNLEECQPHIHDEGCYAYICGKEEHTHTQECSIGESSNLNNRNLTDVTLTQSIINNTQIQLAATVSGTGIYAFEWEYKDKDNNEDWMSLTDIDANIIIIDDEMMEALNNDNHVRVKAYEGDTLVGISNEIIIELFNRIELNATSLEGITVTMSGLISSFPFPVDEMTLTIEEMPGVEDEAGGINMDAFSQIDENERAIEAINKLDAVLDISEEIPLEKRLFDIVLWKDGEEIEPIGPVELTFGGLLKPDTPAEVKVYHIDEESNVVSDMNAKQTEDGNIVVATDHLSIYAVTLAEVMPMAAPAGTEVNTVDSKADGITINLFDYNTSTINNGKVFKFGPTGTEAFNKWTGAGNGAYKGILSNTLGANGFPLLNNAVTGSSQSLNYLFDNTTTIKEAYLDVNNLFEKVDGYYKFDSNDSYAYYNKSQGNGGVFQVNSPTYVQADKTQVGFFPFNVYDSTKTDLSTGGYYNHYFGMTMEAKFQMPPQGKIPIADDQYEDMIFNFSGDDDAWVFIDGVLVLDIGGIHDALGGSINFATGDVTINKAYHNSPGTPITRSITDIIDDVNGRTWDNTPFSEHKISFYYLERGANKSTLSLSFNLPTYKKQNLEISKEVEDIKSEINPDSEYQFQLFLKEGIGNANFELYKGPAKYQDNTDVTFNEEGVFTLKKDQIITVPDLINIKKYQLKELNINSEQFASATVDGVPLSPVYAEGSNIFEVTSPERIVKDKLEIGFKNITAGSLTNLYVEKKWADGNEIHNGESITFQLLDADNKTIKYNGTTEQVLNAENNWSMEFTGLPILYAKDYSVLETEVTGNTTDYTTTYDKIKNSDGTYTHIINNKPAAALGTISAEKKWYQADGTSLVNAPANEVEVQLMRKSSIPDNNYTVTFQVYNINNSSYTPIETRQVKHGGSIEFASGLRTSSTNYRPNAVEISGGNAVNTGGSYTFGSNTVPVYVCNNIINNVTITIKYPIYTNGGLYNYQINNLNEYYSVKLPGSIPDDEPTGTLLKLNKENSWTGSWSELPATSPDGVLSYSYYVKEVSVDGTPVADTDYKVTYINNKGVPYGDIIVENTSKYTYGYVLPETGGIGTLPFSLSGLLFMSAPLLYGYTRHRRERRAEK